MRCGKTLAMLAVAGLPVMAQAAGWYGQVSVGQSRTSRDLVENRESTIVNATALQTQFDDKDNAYRIGAGFRLNEFLAVELNYADLGKHSTVTTMLAGDPPSFAAVAIDRKISGFGADLVLSAPLNPRFSIYGRVGAFRSKLKAEAELAGNIVFTNGDSSETRRSTTQDETVLRYGIGAAWEMWRNGSLHVEWERYNKVGKAFAIGGTGTTGEADTDVAWIGVTQRF
jgi:OOP family OmpA-OmpF porin